MPKRNTFSREFKLEAIRLIESSDKKAANLDRELGGRIRVTPFGSERNILEYQEQFLADPFVARCSSPGRSLDHD